ncbi:MAG: O-antigen ligase family protein, partial [Candidatus Entotheonellia bacterium]
TLVRELRRSGPPIAFQLLGILLAGWLLAGIVSTRPLSLVVGGALAAGFLLLFLANPATGLLLVLLARASTDATLRLLTAADPRGGVIGGLPNIGLVLILTFAGGLYILSRGVPLISLAGGRLLTLLLVTGFLGVMRSDSLLFSMNEWVPLLASFVIYALAAHLFASPRQMQRVVDVIAASFILPAAFGVYQLATGGGVIRPGFSVRGVFGTFVHPNAFGFFLVTVIALFLGQAFFQAGRRRVAAVAGLCIALVLLMGTYARVAWAGALAVLFVVGILRARILLLVLPFAILITLGLVPSVGGRLTDALAGGGTLGHRLLTLWPATLGAWLSATGAEGGTFQVALNRLAGLGPGIGQALGHYGLEGLPHNDYLRVLVEYGIFGLTLYLALISVLAVMAFRTWREFRERNQAAAAVALSFFSLTLAFPVMSITDNIFAHTANQVYFWTLAGLTVA